MKSPGLQEQPLDGGDSMDNAHWKGEQDAQWGLDFSPAAPQR
jgi:hypothetical protein